MERRQRLEVADSTQSAQHYYNGHVTHLLSSMTGTLRLIGLLPRELYGDSASSGSGWCRSQWKRTRKKLLRWKFIRGLPMLLVVFGYLLHFSAANVYNATHKGGFFGFFANCGYVLRNVFAAITLVRFLITRDELITLLEDSLPLRQLLRASREKQVRRYRHVTAAFTLVSFLGIWGATAYAGFGDLQRYFDYYLYKVDVTNGTIPKPLGYVFSFLDATAYGIMCTSMTVLLGFHVYSAIYLRALGAEFEAEVSSAEPERASRTQLKGLRWRLLSLIELLRRFDRVGSPVVFCWYLNEVGNLVLSVPGILVGLGSASIYDYMYRLTDLVINVASFVVLTLALSEPTRLVRDSYRSALWLAASGVPGAQALADSAQ